MLIIMDGHTLLSKRQADVRSAQPDARYVMLETHSDACN